jgi:hypothetical protein
VETDVRIACRYHGIPTRQDDGIVVWEDEVILAHDSKLAWGLEAQCEAKVESNGGGRTVLIKASNQDRRYSFGYIIVVDEDVARVRHP